MPSDIFNGKCGSLEATGNLYADGEDEVATPCEELHVLEPQQRHLNVGSRGIGREMMSQKAFNCSHQHQVGPAGPQGAFQEKERRECSRALRTCQEPEVEHDPVLERYLVELRRTFCPCNTLVSMKIEDPILRVGSGTPSPHLPRVGRQSWGLEGFHAPLGDVPYPQSMKWVFPERLPWQHGLDGLRRLHTRYTTVFLSLQRTVSS